MQGSKWISLGFEVGAHTVNHMDLGQCGGAAATAEIVDCGRALEAITGKPADLFSFPFGRVANTSSETRQSVQQAGYVALFSAHGGFIGSGTDAYDIPRWGASWEAPPLYCLLQLEGLVLSQIAGVVRR